MLPVPAASPLPALALPCPPRPSLSPSPALLTGASGPGDLIVGAQDEGGGLVGAVGADMGNALRVLPEIE